MESAPQKHSVPWQGGRRRGASGVVVVVGEPRRAPHLRESGGAVSKQAGIRWGGVRRERAVGGTESRVSGVMP